MRINFYESDGKHVVSTDMNREGYEDEYEDEPSTMDEWDQRMANAEGEIRDIVGELIKNGGGTKVS